MIIHLKEGLGLNDSDGLGYDLHQYPREYHRHLLSQLSLFCFVSPGGGYPVSFQPHHLHHHLRHHLHHPHPHQDPPPQLGDGEVVLALEGATLCNSDLHTLTGRSFLISVILVIVVIFVNSIFTLRFSKSGR